MKKRRTDYVAPAIAWEHEFVALTVSPPPCQPGSQPNCTGRPPPGWHGR